MFSSALPCSNATRESMKGLANLAKTELLLPPTVSFSFTWAWTQVGRYSTMKIGNNVKNTNEHTRRSRATIHHYFVDRQMAISVSTGALRWTRTRNKIDIVGFCIAPSIDFPTRPEELASPRRSFLFLRE